MARPTFNIPGHVHFLTCSCYHRYNLLSDPSACALLGVALENARNIAGFALWAYVFMPNHIHLLIRPRDDHYTMAAIQRSFKEPFAREYVRYMRHHNPAILESLRFTNGSQRSHRVWQRGGGFDRNLYTPEYVRRAIAYTESNPVRRGYVESPEQWRWSSARARAGLTDAPATVDPCSGLM